MQSLTNSTFVGLVAVKTTPLIKGLKDNFFSDGMIWTTASPILIAKEFENYNLDIIRERSTYMVLKFIIRNYVTRKKKFHKI